MNTRSNFTSAFTIAILAVIVLLPLSGIAQVSTMTATKTESVTTEQITHMTATVTAVDQKTRTLTLKGAEGNEITMTVGEEVKRLNEIKVGDQLEVGYLQSLGLEFRPASMEELKDPLKITEMSDKADNSRAPAGAKLRTIRAVVTVEGVSRWINTVTVRGPLGNYHIVSVEPDMVKWETMCIGQTLVATYTEALVMSIDPVKKK